MLRLLVSAILAVLSFQSIANEWVSPIDRKYRSNDPELFVQLAEAREILDSWGGQREKLIRADEILRSILETDENYAPAYREYGRLFIKAGYVNYDNFKEGSLDPSESAILKSLEIEPDYADSYVLLGHLYTKMKRYQEAEVALRKAEDIGTGIPWLSLNWADLLTKQGKYDAALKRYHKVVNTGTSNRNAYSKALSGITQIHRYMRNYEKANEGYLAEIKYSPNDAWTWGNYSAFLLFSYEDVDGAIEKGEKALSIMNYGMGRLILGCALYTKWAMLKDSPKTTAEAQIYFDRAWQIYPNPEKVIEETRKSSYTSITAVALERWLASKDREQSVAAPVL